MQVVSTINCSNRNLWGHWKRCHPCCEGAAVGGCGGAAAPRQVHHHTGAPGTGINHDYTTLQMTTVLEDNVHNFAVDGSSDDLDVPIKAVFAEPDYVAKHNLCSINSINWARILVQISHYFYCYFQLAEKIGGPVEIVVPTGACGNIACKLFQTFIRFNPPQLAMWRTPWAYPSAWWPPSLLMTLSTGHFR